MTWLSKAYGDVAKKQSSCCRPSSTCCDGAIVAASDHPLPQAAKDDENLYTSCIAGALLRGQYLKAIRDAGFETVEVLDDPITSPVDQLEGVAAGITVLAVR